MGRRCAGEALPGFSTKPLQTKNRGRTGHSKRALKPGGKVDIQAGASFRVQGWSADAHGRLGGVLIVETHRQMLWDRLDLPPRFSNPPSSSTACPNPAVAMERARGHRDSG